ncbi:MAG TPA: HEPN domain-containing protein [Thermoanaerobaculia bacterium]|nr:HEPN domain-containing protein [Thermoanaerobaculia bacterium]
MTNRAEDWLRQAEADLKLARTALAGESFEWSCFAAQQAAEKAVKAVHYAEGSSARGHSVTGLLEEISSEPPPGGVLLEAARRLDRHYIPARYPNGFPAGAPVDFFTREDAESAIDHASAILEWCSRRAR